jgi:hypothetical protein
MWLSVIGYSVSPSERVLLGEVPYRDFLYNYTPGTLWLNALLMKLFGPTLITINLGLLVFKVLTLAVLFLLGASLFGRWPALLPVGLTLAWLGHRYIYGVVPTQYSLLFALLSLASMLKYDREARHWWLLLSGLGAGCVLIFKYNVGIALFGCGSAVVIARAMMSNNDDNRWLRSLNAGVRSAAVYWVGFGIPVLAMLTYLAFSDALMPMINHFLHHAAEYTDVRSVGLPAPKLLIPTMTGFVVAAIGWIVLFRWLPGYLVTYSTLILIISCAAVIVPGRAYIIKMSAQASVAYLPIFLFVISAALLLWHLKRQGSSIEGRRDWWKRFGSLVIVTVFAIGVYLEMYPRADDYHLVRVLPLVFLLLTMLIVHYWADFRVFKNGNPGNSTVRLMVAAIPLSLLFMTGIHQTWRPHFVSGGFSDRVPLPLARANGVMVSPRLAQFIDGMARTIEDNSAPDDTIFSFAQRGSGFYFLTGRRNPTKFVWWRSVGIDSQNRQVVLEMIGNKVPKLILLQDSLSNQQVRDTVTSNYHRIASVTDIGVYGRND